MDDLIVRILLGVPGILLAITCRYAAQAYVADKLGDPTGRSLGRVSLNPAVHYDPMGTFIFPLIGAAIGGVMFGWGREVPIDARMFKNVKQGVFWTSFAGPLANIALVVLFTFLQVATLLYFPKESPYLMPLNQMLTSGIMINMVIAIFNLLPVPPLDGAKMLATFLNYEDARKFEELQRYSFLILLVLMFSGVYKWLFFPAQVAIGALMKFFYMILG